MTKAEITAIYADVMEYARTELPKLIDDAYEYFWEEEDPTEIVGGQALELALLNFEDWFVCDYRHGDYATSIVDIYINAKDPDETVKAVLTKLRDSHLSMYEVTRQGNPIGLKDIALNEDEFELDDSQLESLEPGYVFATRFIEVDGKQIMGTGVYPFGKEMKDPIIYLIEAQFKRYTKNKNTEGTMKDFLKDEPYAFNMTWVSCLYRPKKDDTKEE